MEGQNFLGWLLGLSTFDFSFRRATLCCSFPDWFFREDTSKAHCSGDGESARCLPTGSVYTHTHTHTHTHRAGGAEATGAPGFFFESSMLKPTTNKYRGPGMYQAS